MRINRIRSLSCALITTAMFLSLGTLTFADDEEIKALPDGPGKAQVAKSCFECHGAGNFRKVRLDKDAWADQVADMVDRGAKANETEMAVIVDYLTQNFGKDSKVNVNTAPLVELKVVLGLSVKESQAVIDYREANGKFKTSQDLKKVPDMDAAKIDAKKEMIVF